MKYGLTFLVVAVALLSAPIAQAKRFNFGGTVDGEPDSSIHFDLDGNKKGTKFTSIEHITIWEVPLQCDSSLDRDGFFFMFGPFGVEGGAFTAAFSDSGTSIELTGTLAQKGKKVSGTVTADTADNCSADVPWSGKRLK
jgi:hypothetical protein